jgi:hypothetical protein
MTARDLLAWPALFAVIAAFVGLLVIEGLHVAGVRWRAGWLEALGAVVAVAAIVVSAARFWVYT